MKHKGKVEGRNEDMESNKPPLKSTRRKRGAVVAEEGRYLSGSNESTKWGSFDF